MPANIVHLLISNKAVKLFQNGGEYQKFIDILDSDQNKPFLNLGSIGPDLSYYGSIVEGFKSLVLDGVDTPKGVDGWSYLLHSREPNKFPMKMLEITWKDAEWEKAEWEGEDISKFAFICGFLSHIAADQIIHPMVNRIAGPYYREGHHRKIHRECECYQDVAIYSFLYKDEDFMKTNFKNWVDIITGYSLRNTPEWFRYFIQRGFVESHGVYPTDEEIENWVDGLLNTLRGIKVMGPYKNAYEEYRQYRLNGQHFRDYFINQNYFEDYFLKAVELTGVYWRAVFEVYDPSEDEKFEISENTKNRFCSIVQNDDLSSPLSTDILQSAKNAIQKKIPDKFKGLLADIGVCINKDTILAINPADVGKFA